MSRVSRGTFLGTAGFTTTPAFSAAAICRQKDESPERRPRWIESVVELVQARFSEPLRLSDVAKQIGFHPVHVARIFRRHFGITIGEFIRQMRIGFARECLLGTDQSLVEIGLSAGFPSQAYFTTTFKRETGFTPGEYRRASRRAVGPQIRISPAFRCSEGGSARLGSGCRA